MEAKNSSDIDLKPQYIVVDDSCWKSVPVLSEGLFSEKSDENIFRHPLILLQLQLAIFVILASIVHLFVKRFHLPRLISEVLAGLILGPTILGWLFPKVSDLLFSQQSMKILSTLTRFGYLFFMFMIGVKMDATLIAKAGKREWTIGYMVLILPLIIITAIAKGISVTSDNIDLQSTRMDWVGIFSGTLMLTSFPVVACFLMHLKIINSELGHLALSIALISDLSSVVIINLDTYQKLANLASPRAAFKSMFLCIALVVFIIVVLRSVMYWMIRRTPQGKPVKDAFIYIIVIALLLVGIVGDGVGLLYMYGPFILGLTVPTGPPLATTLIEKLDTIITGWMLPLMSTYCGFRSNLWELNKRPPAFVVFVITIGFLVKIGSAFVPALCFKMPCKKWNSKGKLNSDSKDLRALNCKVLNKAPCSVGILIDRSRIPGPSALSKVSEYRVCVIYVGGKDDREALAIARRMRGWPTVHLIIVRLIAFNDCPEQGWESMLDNECLREMKHPTTNLGNVLYREELVKDATETCQLVGFIVEENYDLILVGRHSQTQSAVIEGLSEWSELPELGPIGDQLASSDITYPVSVFVVQQQITERQ